VFTFLGAHGAEHGIDGDQVGVYAASANVTGAGEFLLGEQAAPGIRCATLYYGNPPVGRLRNDLPVLFVVAESDVTGSADALRGLWGRVIEAGAPWTLLFASDLPHAFDAFSETEDARRIIAQTIAFWKSHLEAPAPLAGPSSAARAIIAARYGHDNPKAIELLRTWIAEHPKDADAHVELGEVSLTEKRYPEATAAFESALALEPKKTDAISGLGLARLGEGRWDEAADLLTQAIAAGSPSSFLYGQLAMAQLQAGRNAEAVASYEKAFAVGIPAGANTRGVAWYNLACAHARLGQKDQAFAALGRAIDEGFSNRQTYEEDPDLAPLRSDSRFAALLGRLPAPGS
jgi:tetratricopeptide (TPR) repeat protein